MDFHTTRRSRDSPGTRKLPNSTGRAFTADTISFTGYLTDVSQPDGTHVADRIEVFTGFSLHGKPVTPEGFGSDYGLYFHAVDKGIGGPPPNILDFKSVEVELKADPGNHNGPVISDASGITGCSTLSIEFPVEERIGSGESGSISILTEC